MVCILSFMKRSLFICLEMNNEISRPKNMILMFRFLYRKPINFTGVGCGGMDSFLRISSVYQMYPAPGLPLLETSRLFYFYL
jgi:hypothetical protein